MLQTKFVLKLILNHLLGILPILGGGSIKLLQYNKFEYILNTMAKETHFTNLSILKAIQGIIIVIYFQIGFTAYNKITNINYHHYIELIGST